MRASVAVFDSGASASKGISGTVYFAKTSEGKTRVTFDLRGFVPNTTHGVHLHEAGDLTEGCKGACAHFNPLGTTHGSRACGGPRHTGDLCNNVTSNSRGVVKSQYVDDLLTVEDTYGRGVVIHKWADDLGIGGYDLLPARQAARLAEQRGYKTKDPARTLNEESKKTGNAGQRIACAVVGRVACPS